MKFKSIFAKLMLNHILILIFTLLGTSLLITFLFQGYLYELKEKELVAEGKNISENIKPLLLQREDPKPLIDLLNGSNRPLGTEVWLVDSKGTVIAASADHSYCEGNTLEESEIMQIVAGKIAVTKGRSQYFKEPVIRVTVPLIYESKLMGSIILYSPLMGNTEIINQLIKLIVIASLLVIIVAITISYLLSKTWTKPLLEMHSAATEMAEGNFRNYVNHASNDEIGQLGQAFNKMAKKLEQNEGTRKKFVADVAHELRTPITSIQGFVETLREGKVEDKNLQQECLEIVNEETKRLSRLVNQLLDLSNLDAHSIKPELKPVNISEIIDKVAEAFKLQFSQKKIKVNCEFSENIFVSVDRDRLYQSIYNLIDNAVKFSNPEGEISVKAFAEEKEVIVEIADQGIGIPNDQLDKIWERFYKVDPARNRKLKGTGLGLAIVKENIELMGGSIQVQSKFGVGTKFRLRLLKAAT